ncbi:kinase [Anaeramoeba flamelloides]|uniref:Kinase n=1 Tax=Anaeramoeba flamelloides TaxID=1746091 RepID=A0ABQ8ZDX8_9EUKA|nr:kinase [Anaeramoeba flamelloides]
MSKSQNQVGGHGSILKLPDGKLAKPITHEEGKFYVFIEDMEKYKPLRPFFPKTFGFFDASQDEIHTITNSEELVETKPLRTLDEVEINNNHKRYFVMENLMYGMTKPCIMDLKMGRRGYGIGAKENKVKSQSRKCKASTSWTHGFRMVGMKRFNKKINEYEKKDKAWGRKLSGDKADVSLRIFLHDGVEFKMAVAKQFLEDMKNLKQTLEPFSDIRLFSSSILIIYDAESDKYCFKLIDFAHSYINIPKGQDEDGYLFGLNYLIGALEKIINEYK